MAGWAGWWGNEGFWSRKANAQLVGYVNPSTPFRTPSLGKVQNASGKFVKADLGRYRGSSSGGEDTSR
jgi:hypothetical protein